MSDTDRLAALLHELGIGCMQPFAASRDVCVPTDPRYADHHPRTAARLIAAGVTLATGTTTDCPLVGVHEHAFRGPHRFREWDPLEGGYAEINGRLQYVVAAPTPPDAPDVRGATSLGAFLHQKGIGCDGHSDDDRNVTRAMHVDDAHDILNHLAPTPPDALLRRIGGVPHNHRQEDNPDCGEQVVGNCLALRAALAPTPPDAPLTDWDTGYVHAIRDHDECCGTLRNHKPGAAPTPPDALLGEPIGTDAGPVPNWVYMADVPPEPEAPPDFGMQVFTRGWLPRELRDDDYVDEIPRSGAVIVWVLGAIVAALIVAVAWLAWTR